jgi:hypothetical protein
MKCHTLHVLNPGLLHTFSQADEGGLRGALQAAADPLQRSTNAAVLFAKTGDDMAYTRFFTTIIASNSALRRVAAAAEDPTGLQAAALAYTRMAAINETLSVRN